MRFIFYRLNISVNLFISPTIRLQVQSNSR